MKKLSLAAFILFLIANTCPAWAFQCSFSGYGTRLFGVIDKSRMFTVVFSVDESLPSSEVVATLRFMNTGNSPIKGDPFFSQATQIVSKDRKTYEVSWVTEMVELKDEVRELIRSGDDVPSSARDKARVRTLNNRSGRISA